jgi:S1-C subfamily serine protease
MPDSPAAKAGIQAEDIIVSVNGVKLSVDKAIGQIIQQYSIGETVTLEIRRGEKTITIPVVLEERKDL